MSSLAGHVVIGGGTGFIGSHLCKLLKSKGYNVTVISRMPGPQRMSWQDLQKNGLPVHTCAVVNLAGQNVLDFKQRWSDGFKQNVWNSRVNTTTSLAEAIAKGPARPAVFVTISGVGIYEPSSTEEYNENSRLNEYDFLSKLAFHWEKAAILPPNIPCRSVTIRSGVVLGKNGGMIKQLYLPFYFGMGGPINPGDQYLPWIHVEDITRMIQFAIENEGVRGVLNGVAPHIITNKEFTNAFASALWRPALFPVPQSILNIFLNEERANMLTKGQKVIPKRTMELGFNYTYPTIQEACKQLVSKE